MRYLYFLVKVFNWIRFGKVSKRVKDMINYTVCEEEFYGRNNKVIGYWAYGYYDPSLPYQGQRVFQVYRRVG